MGAAAPKPPLAIPPLSKLRGILAIRVEEDRELRWMRTNRTMGDLCGYDGLALALLRRAVMDAQETTEINWNWPAGTGYEEARAFLRSAECGRWVRALGLALSRDLEVCDLARWAGDPEGRHEEEGS